MLNVETLVTREACIESNDGAMLKFRRECYGCAATKMQRKMSLLCVCNVVRNKWQLLA